MAKTFAEFLNESKEIEGVITTLKSLGYKDVVKISGQRASFKTNNDRVSELQNLAKEFKGSYYDPTVGGSSVGGLKLSSGKVILAKPVKAKGSGAGAYGTKIVESAQCIYCAARWYMDGKYDRESLIKAARHVDIDVPVKEVLDNIDDEWIDVFIQSAEKLHKAYGKNGLKFHRASNIVQAIDKKYNDLNRKEKEFTRIDKWSPADIYIVGQSVRPGDFNKANSLVEFNALLLKMAREKTLVGVSLKKTKNPKISYVNFDENRSTYEIKEPYYTLGKQDFFNSKDIYMYYRDGQIQFRGFGNKDWQGEIKGKYASHGKVGGQPLNNIIKKITGVSMNRNPEIIDMYTKNYDKFAKEFYKYYEAVVQKKKMGFDEFNSKLSDKTNDPNWMVSKFQGVHMLYLLKSKNINLDEYIGRVIGYASSKSELSAPYIKVS